MIPESTALALANPVNPYSNRLDKNNPVSKNYPVNRCMDLRGVARSHTVNAPCAISAHREVDQGKVEEIQSSWQGGLLITGHPAADNPVYNHHPQRFQQVTISKTGV